MEEVDRNNTDIVEHNPARLRGIRPSAIPHSRDGHGGSEK